MAGASLSRTVPKLSPPSGGPPVIVVQNTTEPLPTLNRSIHPGAVDQPLDQLIVEPLVIALHVVMLRVLLHGLAKVPLAQRNAQKTWLLRDSAEWQAQLAQHSDLTERAGSQYHRG